MPFWGQKFMARQFRVASGEPNTTILPSGDCIKLIPDNNIIPLYQCISQPLFEKLLFSVDDDYH